MCSCAMTIVLYVVVVCSLLCWFILIIEEVNDDDNDQEITVARDKYVKYTNGQWKTFALGCSMSVCVSTQFFLSFVVQTIGFSLWPIKM